MITQWHDSGLLPLYPNSSARGQARSAACGGSGGCRRVIVTWEVPTKFKVALYKSEEGVAVCAPSLPGCWSQGETVEEALANIADAIREYLQTEDQQGEGAELTEVEVTI
jgi:predicted RNase H-like HicB family nuclease